MMLTKNTMCGLAILVDYVDDILLIGSDDTSIHVMNTYLHQHLSICVMSDRLVNPAVHWN